MAVTDRLSLGFIGPNMRSDKSIDRPSDGNLIARSREPIYLSPLRYPGSKRQMIPLVSSIISSIPEPVDLFVEPFAGGASVSLQLAGWGTVGGVVLADRDPLVYAFWRVATEDAAWLIDQIHEIEVSLPMWEKMRASEPTEHRDMALKCLFLNRTNFSGILHRSAGPLGGKTQESRTIDCRFPRDTLARRIRAVSDLFEMGRIRAVWPFDYQDTITEVRRIRGTSNTVLFLDPPFYAKGQALYRFAFDSEDHLALSLMLRRMKLPYILSYDDHHKVRSLYNGTVYPRFITTEYRAAASPTRRVASELVVTNIQGWEDESGGRPDV